MALPDGGEDVVADVANPQRTRYDRRVGGSPRMKIRHTPTPAVLTHPGRRLRHGGIATRRTRVTRDAAATARHLPCEGLQRRTGTRRPDRQQPSPWPGHVCIASDTAACVPWGIAAMKRPRCVVMSCVSGVPQPIQGGSHHATRTRGMRPAHNWATSYAGTRAARRCARRHPRLHATQGRLRTARSFSAPTCSSTRLREDDPPRAR